MIDGIRKIPSRHMDGVEGWASQHRELLGIAVRKNSEHFTSVKLRSNLMG